MIHVFQNELSFHLYSYHIRVHQHIQMCSLSDLTVTTCNPVCSYGSQIDYSVPSHTLSCSRIVITRSFVSKICTMFVTAETAPEAISSIALAACCPNC